MRRSQSAGRDMWSYNRRNTSNYRHNATPQPGKRDNFPVYLPPPPIDRRAFDPFYFQRHNVTERRRTQSTGTFGYFDQQINQNNWIQQNAPYSSYNDFQTQQPNISSISPGCPFCDERNPEFRDISQLKSHYADFCPMLVRCGFCDKAVEVAKLNLHYLTKCNFLKNSMKPCTRCGQAETAEDQQKHEDGTNCHTVSPVQGHAWCPLCDKQVWNGQSGWKQHLIGGHGCQGNLRRSSYGCGPPRDPTSKKADSVKKLIEQQNMNVAKTKKM